MKKRIFKLIFYVFIPIVCIIIAPRTYELMKLQSNYPYLETSVSVLKENVSEGFDLATFEYTVDDKVYVYRLLVDSSVLKVGDKGTLYYEKSNPGNIVQFSYKSIDLSGYFMIYACLILIELLYLKKILKTKFENWNFILKEKIQQKRNSK